MIVAKACNGELAAHLRRYFRQFDLRRAYSILKALIGSFNLCFAKNRFQDLSAGVCGGRTGASTVLCNSRTLFETNLLIKKHPFDARH